MDTGAYQRRCAVVQIGGCLEALVAGSPETSARCAIQSSLRVRVVADKEYHNSEGKVKTAILIKKTSHKTSNVWGVRCSTAG